MADQPTLDDALAEARTRRDQGRRQAVAALPPAWRVAAEHAIDTLAATGQPFSADDVRDRVGHAMGRPADNSFGGLFAKACRAGRIEPAGYTQSRRVEGRGRVLRLWRGTPAGGAGDPNPNATCPRCGTAFFTVGPAGTWCASCYAGAEAGGSA
jgi:ribosomal protein L37E